MWRPNWENLSLARRSPKACRQCRIEGWVKRQGPGGSLKDNFAPAPYIQSREYTLEIDRAASNGPKGGVPVPLRRLGVPTRGPNESDDVSGGAAFELTLLEEPALPVSIARQIACYCGKSGNGISHRTLTSGNLSWTCAPGFGPRQNKCERHSRGKRLPRQDSPRIRQMSRTFGATFPRTPFPGRIRYLSTSSPYRHCFYLSW